MFPKAYTGSIGNFSNPQSNRYCPVLCCCYRVVSHQGGTGGKGGVEILLVALINATETGMSLTYFGRLAR